MRTHFAVLAAVSVALTGCGYVGDPLPPALNIPRPVADLTAVQRGSKLIISFTAPTMSNEDLLLDRFDGIDVRVSDKPVKADRPEPGKPVTVEVPAAEWQGQDARIAVRLAGPKGRFSAFSPVLVVPVGTPLATPKATVTPHPEGVRLTWTAVPGERYRIFRDEALVGSADGAEFIDKSVTFGKEYKYSVQAFVEMRESDPTATFPITPRDQFPPAAPKGLQAVAGLRSTEVAWDRSPEPDLAVYRVYRAIGSGEFSVLVDGVEGIAFSDRQVEPATAYRYRITALDKSGNESEPSAVLEIRRP
ncbi:MAG: hypothetical protein SGI92_32760 [Bryobacteraceae bacterium]|nr:hypothetical protein [Bryobacteraceae bacterium]